MLKTNLPDKTPSAELRLAVLCSIDHAEGISRIARIREIAKRDHKDPITGNVHRFTWRTIQTWFSRYQKDGITSVEKKARKDKHTHRKVSISQVAEGIKEVLPDINTNKVGRSIRMAVYKTLLKKGLFTRSKMAPNTFYRIVRENNLLNNENYDKLRLSFSMLYANEMWQADTMVGPSLKVDGKWKKTFFIAFIDDASRVIAHGQWFFNDNTENMISAFRSAMFKRGKPERLYFDNGSNYKASEIHKACLRLNIKLSHTPIRDGAAKGKIERFFRGFRDRFLTVQSNFTSLEDLNTRTQDWLENEYNSQPHRGIGMIPIDRFNMDLGRIVYLHDDEYCEEAFYHSEVRKVNGTNCIQIHKKTLECPVYLRGKNVEVRFDRTRQNHYLIYYKDKRMGEAKPVDLYGNAQGRRKTLPHHNNNRKGQTL